MNATTKRKNTILLITGTEHETHPTGHFPVTRSVYLADSLLQISYSSLSALRLSYDRDLE